ncbi:hypothetical protein [Kitasatospora sp. GP82]|uniref:hypothetical protein n=1 Tax=Kitasatospora sp. GP82 TaxID=3035089 RepID=UPI0024739B7E|nr:hypothetical protein [Kitasatospora sp. GP82]MDH6124059.1 hypothetical protein [Kitasatospora sp. GP82]
MSSTQLTSPPQTAIVPPGGPTTFGSLAHHPSGGVQVIDDDPRHYVFSNVFAVAKAGAPYLRTAVAINQEYVLEATRAEGPSPWWSAAHDEFVLVMDGRVTVWLRKPTAPLVEPDHDGAVVFTAEPEGVPMGTIEAGRGHMVLLPAHSAYRFVPETSAVLLFQTVAGPQTEFRWNEICQTS